jgi:dTDP-4-dehydrorhamnose 3,5-epimerase
MRVTPTELTGVILIEPQVFGDPRGYFLETFNQDRYRQAGLPGEFVQDNVSFSSRGVLRGLHFQHPKGQGKLVTVLQGEAYDVAIDVRKGSPQFGKWIGVVLSGENKRQLYIPAGFAHGFCVTGESAMFAYKCTEFYAPESERGIAWNDPDIGIRWPIETPTLSTKDARYPRLRDVSRAELPVYAAEPSR